MDSTIEQILKETGATGVKDIVWRDKNTTWLVRGVWVIIFHKGKHLGFDTFSELLEFLLTESVETVTND